MENPVATFTFVSSEKNTLATIQIAGSALMLNGQKIGEITEYDPTTGNLTFEITDDAMALITATKDQINANTMNLVRIVKLDENDLARLHDALFGVFGVNVTNAQIKKLLTSLCPQWDGETDTCGIDDTLDNICQHFVGMNVPMYGDSQKYKDNFWQAIKDKKTDFLNFINI